MTGTTLTRSERNRLTETERRHTWTANEGRVPVMPGANMYAAAIIVRTSTAVSTSRSSRDTAPSAVP